MACPFFMPVSKLESSLWQHPHRLPLGSGWSGHCTAPEHEGEIPSPEHLRDFCNLGYAEGCGNLPHTRPWDSVRFSARSLEATGAVGPRIQLRYVCERAHRPADHEFLYFNLNESQWASRHTDPRIQRMAECFLASHLEKGNREVHRVAS